MNTVVPSSTASGSIAGAVSGSTPDAAEAATEKSPMQIVPLSDVSVEAHQWLWPQYLPLGKLVVIDGFPGQGKSMLTLDIAARLSRGASMPDGRVGDTGTTPTDTVILTYEDDAAGTLRPRLEAAGGDATRVHHVAGVLRPGEDGLTPTSLPDDLDALEHALIERPNVRFVVIDPLSAAFGGDVDSHTEKGIRRILAHLSRIASSRNVCISIVRHVRKAHGRNAITAGGGSIGIIGHVRVGLLVDQCPGDPARSVLAVAKNNLAAKGATLSFTKMDAEVMTSDGVRVHSSKLEWGAIVGVSADEILEARSGAPTVNVIDSAEEWLTEVLSSDWEHTRTDVLALGLETGFNRRTVDRAAIRLGVVRRISGFGSNRRSHWSLPTVPVEGVSIPDSTDPAPESQFVEEGSDSPIRDNSVIRDKKTTHVELSLMDEVVPYGAEGEAAA